MHRGAANPGCRRLSSRRLVRKSRLKAAAGKIARPTTIEFEVSRNLFPFRQYSIT
jgi:hypothetical protein